MDFFAGSLEARPSPPSQGGVTISGVGHVVFYKGLDGREHTADAALAGNVLVWHEDGVARRLEAGVGRERALDLAAALE